MEIKVTPRFMRQAHKFMSKEALQELVDELSLYPNKNELKKLLSILLEEYKNE